ncbi:hypothetical protein A0H76_1213 [Hepatospora eriocheir]|uniref:Uncharacterized protein n=1 Tax=Hepatospora eriocheir TaxID=1081669 RepID=A0A1X0Q612_9MICR|nr:hypothetical protein A0H76_1213 [Hepatospora eriocheir]
MMLKISYLIFLILTTVNIITAYPIGNGTVESFINGTIASDENSSGLTVFEVIDIIILVIMGLFLSCLCLCDICKK